MYKRASNNSNNNNQTRICHVTCKPHDLTIACVCLQQRTLGRAVFSRCAFRAHIARSVTTRCLVCRDSVLTSFTVNAFPARLRWTLVWETIFAIGSGLFIRRCRVECKRLALDAAGFLHIRVSVCANGRVCSHELAWMVESVIARALPTLRGLPYPLIFLHPAGRTKKARHLRFNWAVLARWALGAWGGTFVRAVPACRALGALFNQWYTARWVAAGGAFFAFGFKAPFVVPG